LQTNFDAKIAFIFHKTLKTHKTFPITNAACNRLPPESQPVGMTFQLLSLSFESFVVL
jgi:hypothetical protein